MLVHNGEFAEVFARDLRVGGSCSYGGAECRVFGIAPNGKIILSHPSKGELTISPNAIVHCAVASLRGE
jgi:hypothetical protein